MDRSQQFLHFHQQPFAGGSLSNWLRMLTRNRFRVSPVYVARAAYVSLLSTVTALPRLVEHRYDGLVAGQDVSPVFILGHFRSGTTFLHTLMSHDPSLGYMSTFQTMLPGNFIWKAGLFKRILADSLPETRPMDNVEMAVDYPYEEEYAVANICPYSFYHGWYFPRRMRHYFNRYALMQAPSREITGWKTIYDYLLRKVAYAAGQPRLLLKNPCNTARVKELLELYPDAKFVHIYRNPYHVFFPPGGSTTTFCHCTRSRNTTGMTSQKTSCTATGPCTTGSSSSEASSPTATSSKYDTRTSSPGHWTPCGTYTPGSICPGLRRRSSISPTTLPPSATTRPDGTTSAGTCRSASTGTGIPPSTGGNTSPVDGKKRLSSRPRRPPLQARQVADAI